MHLHCGQDGITEDEVIREANREKVLEMYGTSKIEAIPLSNGAGKTDVQEVTVESHQVAEFTSGRLFAPPSNKRALRHPNPPVISSSEECSTCYNHHISLVNMLLYNMGHAKKS